MSYEALVSGLILPLLAKPFESSFFLVARNYVGLGRSRISSVSAEAFAEHLMVSAVSGSSSCIFSLSRMGKASFGLPAFRCKHVGELLL